MPDYKLIHLFDRLNHKRFKRDMNLLKWNLFNNRFLVSWYYLIKDDRRFLTLKLETRIE